MKIGLLTTLGTNIGDDFIREGICKIISQVFNGQAIQYVPVNKHYPDTVYPAWHPVHWLPRGRRTVRRWSSRFGISKFDKCDVIVQCGAPVFWPACHRCEWAEPIWYEIIERVNRRIPVLNLAAGSCFPWERQPVVVEDIDDQKFIGDILSYCSITTVRDTLAESICKSLGVNTPRIPCSAFLAAPSSANRQKSDLVLINYMEGGGHYDWGQNIDAKVWRDVMTQLLRRLSKRHRLAFLCHDEKEAMLAKDLDGALPRFQPKSTADYFSCVSNAKVAICNRMHASVGMAGMGIPSVSICSDTRLLMVAELQLPCYYVKDATVENLESSVESLLHDRAQENERLLALKARTMADYIRIVEMVCNK